MIRIKQFHFSQDIVKGKTLEPIVFDEGLNFIVGEKSDDKKEGNKMNGVGKSLLIESINFCLLKKIDESRVSKISDIDVDPSIYFCLKLEIESTDKIKIVEIRRNRIEKSDIVFFVDDEYKSMKFDEAKKYLDFLFFEDSQVELRPSFRSLLSILIREEDTRFNDILRPYNKSNLEVFEELVKPHLYLFNVDLALLDRIKIVSAEAKLLTKSIQSLKKEMTSRGIDEKTIVSYLNDLKDNVEKLSLANDELKSAEGQKQVQAQLSDFEIRVEKLLTERAGKELLIKKIKSLPSVEKIDTKKIQSVYNNFKVGLGDVVKKSFEEVLAFKEEVDSFQKVLMTEKLSSLNKEVAEIDAKIAIIENESSKLYAYLGAKEKIDNLKTTLKLEAEKRTELDRISSTYELWMSQKEKRKSLKKKKLDLVEQFNVVLFAIQETVESFEADLMKIHEHIAGNKHCQFDMKVNESSQQFIEFDYRIKLDGSSGINRIKTFIYDTLLLVNKYTKQRHPGFLIHDNIFASAGKDDMEKSLNYLFELSKKNRFQYILTINKDEFEAGKFQFDVEKLTKAEFTRKEPFLGFEYSEIS
jgi:uncharacterized protein YydD (DUF2326 family)